MAFRFGDFDFSPEARLLTRRGGAVPLTPKAFDLLELLLRHRPLVVSKDAIQDALWPDTFVVEANIANLVREIRVALGDSAREPRYVRTVPGHGYAFQGATTEYSMGRTTATGAVVCGLVGDEHLLLLPEGRHVVGRGRGADLLLTHPTVSRHHASVTVRGTTAVIEDLGSRNGTYVQGHRLTHPMEVTEGADVRIGLVPLRFCLLDAGSRPETLPVPPVPADRGLRASFGES